MLNHRVLHLPHLILIFKMLIQIRRKRQEIIHSIIIQLGHLLPWNRSIQYPHIIPGCQPSRRNWSKMHSIIIPESSVQIIIIWICIRIRKMPDIVHRRVVHRTRRSDKITSIRVQHIDNWSCIEHSHSNRCLHKTVLGVCRDHSQVKSSQLVRKSRPWLITWEIP